jgi:zinc/manganese transport system permease protein
MTVYELLFAPFADFAFMRRALAGCFALSLSAAPVGVFLLLRRMMLIGDSMAHAVLPGTAIGFLVSGLSLPAMSLGGLVAGLVVALAAGSVARATRLGEDASLAAFYQLSLATGVLIIAWRGGNLDLFHVLFGSVLALDDPALFTLGGIATVSLLGLTLIYRGLIIECVDPIFLRPMGRLGHIVHLAFLALVVLNLVGGFQALGTLMAVGILTLPAAAARFWVRRVEPTMLLASVLAFAACLTGLLASYHLALPAGPAIIMTAGGLWLASVALGPHGGLVSPWYPVKAAGAG